MIFRDLGRSMQYYQESREHKAPLGVSLVCHVTISLICIQNVGLVYEYLMHPYLVEVGLSSLISAIVSASLSFSGL